MDTEQTRVVVDVFELNLTTKGREFGVGDSCEFASIRG